MFEDNRVHGSILSLEDQLGWHQSTLTYTEGKRPMSDASPRYWLQSRESQVNLDCKIEEVHQCLEYHRRLQGSFSCREDENVIYED